MVNKSEYYPRILVISNNCFSESGSNGRTLLSLFSAWDKNNIAQFYINSEKPDFSLCSNYYRVTDMDAIRGFFFNNKNGKVKPFINKIENKSIKQFFSLKNKLKNTALGYILRNFIWKFGNWENRFFHEWINKFAPDAILFQAGDYEFMFNVALLLANRYEIPIILYNSEDYYLKNFEKHSLLYNLYFNMYRKTFNYMMNYSSVVIYSNEKLEKSFSSLFNTKSLTLHTPTKLRPILKEFNNKSPIISYLGNLGLRRHESLIEISQALMEINKDFKLDVYGKPPNSHVENALHLAEGIEYHGFIKYDEVIDVMKKSDILVHTESFSEYYQNDLKHAFSTKISDSLAIGIPLFVYAPSSLAVTQYLVKKDAACVVTNKYDLTFRLKDLIYDDDLKQRYIFNAQSTINMDFNNDKICESLLSEIKSAILEKRSCK